MKTYVVTGIKDERNQFKYQEITYAGQDKEKAFNVNINTNYKVFELDVWVKGIRIESYTKKDGYEWVLTFDKITGLKRRIEGAENRLEESKEELKELEAFLKD